ncbi:MAG TPA: helix-turn-helix transcriptional regulator [Candidatus Binatia bacterium]|nr:helix-turn-helix transcriptional regulator [Candidatus Binatia bacterium]
MRAARHDRHRLPSLDMLLVTRTPQVRLTGREREVVDLLCTGLTTKEIAHQLGLSTWTVHSHIANARNRTSSRTTAQLVARWRRRHARSEHVRD